MKARWSLVSVLCAMAMGLFVPALAGCGGGGGDDNDPAPATNGAPAEASMSGVWHGSFNGGVEFSMELDQSADVITGTYVRSGGSGTATGQLNGDDLELTTVRQPGAVVSQWKGTVNDARDAASGSWTNITEGSSGTFSMTKD